MDSAIYLNDVGESRELTVKTENTDGTVELFNSAGVLEISKCRVVESPAVGACVRNKHIAAHTHKK